MKKIQIAILLLAGCCLASCDKKDICLDSGGSYNETTQQCEK